MSVTTDCVRAVRHLCERDVLLIWWMGWSEEKTGITCSSGIIVSIVRRSRGISGMAESNDRIEAGERLSFDEGVEVFE